MLVISGEQGKSTCGNMTRRELLRIGGSALLGLSLADLLQQQGKAMPVPAANTSQGPGWGRAQSVILLYLQGGPSHLDLWDPKDNVPDRVRSPFSADQHLRSWGSRHRAFAAAVRVLDKATLIRSMSYSPNGLFNHTAAIYQMLTGYQADVVSPSGQLEPPSAAGLSEFRLQHCQTQAADACRCCPSS